MRKFEDAERWLIFALWGISLGVLAAAFYAAVKP